MTVALVFPPPYNRYGHQSRHAGGRRGGGKFPTTTKRRIVQAASVVIAGALLSCRSTPRCDAFSFPASQSQQSSTTTTRRFQSSFAEDGTETITTTIIEADADEVVEPARDTGINVVEPDDVDDDDDSNRKLPIVLQKINEKIGTVDEERILFPEYGGEEVPRLFSSLSYNKCQEDGKVTAASHDAGSVASAASLVVGTTVGAGILALPTATAAAGFVPSSAGMLSAWAYMTMSGLLIAELTLNRIGTTGRPGLGLLELYKNSVGRPWSWVGSGAYLFLHYAIMVAYVAQGGSNLDDVFGALGLDGLAAAIPGAGQLAYAAICGSFLYFAKPSLVENVNNALVVGVAATFLAVMGIGAGSVNVDALLDPANQHPDQLVGCLPIIFLSLVYQNVVPTVVTQLEGDRSKITKAIVAGTTIPFIMFQAWNAVVLGNVMGSSGGDIASVGNPVALLQSGAAAGGTLLGPLVGAFSSLALTTSVIGFTYGLYDAWTDVLNINTASDNEDQDKWKLPLFALIFAPPLALSVANPDIFYRALEYGGAFGVSTLFLVLPPIMVWKERYVNVEAPLVTKPMVPLGKVALGSMWKAATVLIVEQGAEKLGIIDAIQQLFQQA